jgi:hypothetical protein
MELELLTCEEIADCPKGCRICTTCLQLLGCLDGQNNFTNTVTSAGPLWIIAAAAGLILFCTVYYNARKRLQDHDGLEAHLMGDESDRTPTPPPTSPVWLAPDIQDPADSGSVSDNGPHVWLAPEIVPVQFEPSHLAAVASSDDSSTAKSPIRAIKQAQSPSAVDDDNVWLAPIM